MLKEVLKTAIKAGPQLTLLVFLGIALLLLISPRTIGFQNNSLPIVYRAVMIVVVIGIMLLIFYLPGNNREK